ncbi:hypothetical protein ACTXT7_006233 [Hymenolepis weldensis]
MKSSSVRTRRRRRRRDRYAWKKNPHPKQLPPLKRNPASLSRSLANKAHPHTSLYLCYNATTTFSIDSTMPLGGEKHIFWVFLLPYPPLSSDSPLACPVIVQTDRLTFPDFKTCPVISSSRHSELIDQSVDQKPQILEDVRSLLFQRLLSKIVT